MWIVQNNLNFEVGIDNLKNILKSKNVDLVEVDIYKNDENMYNKDTFDKFEPSDTKTFSYWVLIDYPEWQPNEGFRRVHFQMSTLTMPVGHITGQKSIC